VEAADEPEVRERALLAQVAELVVQLIAHLPRQRFVAADAARELLDLGSEAEGVGRL
jgi:hypothetical protein